MFSSVQRIRAGPGAVFSEMILVMGPRSIDRLYPITAKQTK